MPTSSLYGQFLRQAGGFIDGNNYHGTYHPLGELRGNTCYVISPFPSWGGDRYQDAYFFLNSDQKPYSYAWPMWAKTHQLILGASQISKLSISCVPKQGMPRRMEN